MSSRRLLAVQALTEIGSAGALQALERGLEDTDREVRITAVRALSSKNYRPALARIEAAVKGKALRDADLKEKMAFFEGYGALCGDAGIPHLDSILNGKGFLGRREDAEIRACAAMALGRVRGPKAIEALKKAAAEKDIVVRNAVTRALRGGAQPGGPSLTPPVASGDAAAAPGDPSDGRVHSPRRPAAHLRDVRRAAVGEALPGRERGGPEGACRAHDPNERVDRQRG